MSSLALLVVPPFIKYSAGPLLGPTLLQAVARRGGHQCTVLDLNARVIRQHISPDRSLLLQRGPFVGDHDKPQIALPNSTLFLSDIERKFLCETVLPCLDAGIGEDALRRVQFGFLKHEHVQSAAAKLASSSFGAWTRKNLEESVQGASPNLLGISLLHAGQVVPAAATSMVSKQLWPEALVTWGGPHVSGIGNAIQEDLYERSFAADLFVTGHAEQTFVDLLDQIASTGRYERQLMGFKKGIRGGSVMPTFDDLSLYDDPPVLPAQSTLGCAYGRCTFCTYPAIEPTPTKLDLCITIESVVEKARSVNGTIAIKDSLVTPRRLREIGETIGGRVKWSACTKLNPKLDFETLKSLYANGLATLEVRLESLLVDTQRRVAKVHSPGLYEDFLHSAARVQGLSVVVNYMTDFPFEDPLAADRKLEEAKRLLVDNLGRRGKLEHNRFELERLSPMVREPERYGIDESSLEFWPWASVVDFQLSQCK